MRRDVSPAFLGLIASGAGTFALLSPMFSQNGSTGLLGLALIGVGAVVSIRTAIRERGQTIPFVAAAVALVSVAYVLLYLSSALRGHA